MCRATMRPIRMAAGSIIGRQSETTTRLRGSPDTNRRIPVPADTATTIPGSGTTGMCSAIESGAMKFALFVRAEQRKREPSLENSE